VVERPKQFLRFLSRHSLFQQTMLRAVQIGRTPLVVCQQAHVHHVNNQLAEIGVSASVLVEPVGRNTAAAIVAAAIWLTRNADDPTMLVMPCDHYVESDQAFLTAIRTAAKSGALIKLLGVEPASDSSSYGYIVPKPHNGYVADFVEKPCAEDIPELRAKGALWNVGVFLGKAQHFLKLSNKLCGPVYHAVVDAMQGSTIHPSYSNVPAIQFDRAVIEKAFDFCSVVKLGCRWSDIGTWRALIDAAADRKGGEFKVTKSLTGNVVTNGPVVHVQTTHPVTVVATTGKILVTDAGADVKFEELPEGPEQSRPWGMFSVLATDPAGQWAIKRLRVDPGGAISLQQHKHRSETWMVLQGQARVTLGDRIMVLEANETVHIPAGTRHRVENTTRQFLEIMEIQTGDYFGEDDIARFHDVYGRV
jgi:mannose-1-phosphate guanylyltransferase/mannose-6-phosphate isomerase